MNFWRKGVGWEWIFVIARSLELQALPYALNRPPRATASFNIELEKTTLPDELAFDVARVLGVDLYWLLEDDVTKPIINDDGQPFKPGEFYRRQAQLRSEKNSPGSIASRVEMQLALNLRRLIAITEATLRGGRYDLFYYKIAWALNTLCNEAHTDLARMPLPKGRSPGVWPDLDAVVADWKSRHDWKAEFESFLATKSGKLPAKHPQHARSLPAVRRAARKPAAKPAKREPARH
jgi:hypothetical protein